MNSKEKFTTIWVKKDTVKKLDKYKIHPRESYGDLVERLINAVKKQK